MLGAQSYVTHTHILSHGFSWAMFRNGEHCGRGTELCHTHIYMCVCTAGCVLHCDNNCIMIHVALTVDDSCCCFNV